MTALSTRSLAIALTLATVGVAGCGLKGSGNPKTETREVEPFHAVDLGGTFELVVHVDPANEQKLEVSGDDNIVPVISTKVSGGTLDVEIDGANLVRPKTPMKIEVWVPNLDEVEVSGSADVDVEGLHGERFELDVSGSADSDLSGTVDTLVVNVSGSGEVEARALMAKDVEVDISGSGKAEVFASDSLDADVSGSGRVRYWGDPGVNSSVSGSGKVTPGSG